MSQQLSIFPMAHTIIPLLTLKFIFGICLGSAIQSNGSYVA